MTGLLCALFALCGAMCDIGPMDSTQDNVQLKDDALSAQRQATAQQLSLLLETWMKGMPAVGSFGQAAPPTPFSIPTMPNNPLSGIINEHFVYPLAQQYKPQLDPSLMKGFFDGLKAYQSCPAFRAKKAPAKSIWQQGTTVLRDYGSDNAGAAAVLVIPSLINRFDILDLSPDHSFLRFLASAGLRPLVLDWGEPGDEEKEYSITDYISQRIIPALDYLVPRVRGGRVHIVGYCMGGLLALALAVLRPALINSLVLMAAPWNFAAAGTMLGVGATGETFIKLVDAMEPQLAANKVFPAEALRLFFASFQPMQILEKFARFSSFDPSGADAQRFALSEDWLNDGVALAAPVARECLRDWYGENRPGKISWRVADTLIDPRNVTCPSYIIAPDKDRLVPPESAKPLARLIRGAVLREPSLGHIGLLSSHVAPQEVWMPLAQWLAQQ